LKKIPSGAFNPKQTDKISDIFKESKVINETRHQTIFNLQNQLKKTESEIKEKFSKNLSLKNMNLFKGTPIKDLDPNINTLIKQKQSLQEKLNRVRLGKGLDTMRNASQLIKGPETILTISDNFTIFDRDAYYSAKASEKDIHERINDIRTLKQIPRDLLPHFNVKELMGPPEIIPNEQEAYKRQMQDPYLNKFAALPEPKIKIPKSPLKAPFKDINEARKNLTPSKLVTPSILPDTSNQLISVGKVSKVVSKQLPKEIPGFEILDQTDKRKQPVSPQPTTPTPPSQKVINKYVQSLTTPPISPMKAKLQTKLKTRSILPSPQVTPPTSVLSSPVKAKVDNTSLTLQEQSLLKNQLIQRIDDKIKNISDKYGETSDPSKDDKLKLQKLRNKKL
jgi:hypothetical protein